MWLHKMGKQSLKSLAGNALEKVSANACCFDSVLLHMHMTVSLPKHCIQSVHIHVHVIGSHLKAEFSLNDLELFLEEIASLHLVHFLLNLQPLQYGTSTILD